MAGLPADWHEVLSGELDEPYFQELMAFVAEERRQHTVYPAEEDVFAAFGHTPFAQVRVLILGQDPYHGPGQAHGLAFSVRPGVAPPPSLVNIFKELKSDAGCEVPRDGTLTPWARQGVMLLNAVLTVRAGAAGSHAGKGWERFTDAVIRAVASRPDHAVFVLWGRYAQAKRPLIDTRHTIVASAHPSPLSARNGFFGSKPFSAINRVLETAGHEPVNWCLPQRADEG